MMQVSVISSTSASRRDAVPLEATCFTSSVKPGSRRLEADRLTETATLCESARHGAHWARAPSSTRAVRVRHQARLFGHGQELRAAGSIARGARVVPPQERLDRGDLARPQVELRLVVEHELLLLDRAAQLLRHQQHVVVVERLVVEGERGVPGLCTEHRHVRASEQAGTVVASVSRIEIPMLAPIRASTMSRTNGSLDALGEALCNALRFFDVCVR